MIALLHRLLFGRRRLAELRQAARAGHRWGYLNGWCDKANGDDHDPLCGNPDVILGDAGILPMQDECPF